MGIAMTDADKLEEMLTQTKRLRGLGVSPLCALRLAVWKIERARPAGECRCGKKTEKGEPTTCDEIAKKGA